MARVLACDDERHIVRLIPVNLERQGYAVQILQDHCKNLDQLRSGAFDNLIMDGDFTDPTTNNLAKAKGEDPSLMNL